MSNSNSVVLACAALLAAGAASANVVEETVASVNGQPILLSDYQKELNAALDFWSKTEPEAMRDPANVKKLRESTLEQLIDGEMLYQEGVKLKIRVRERDIDNGLDEVKQRFTRDETGKELTPAEAEAALYKQIKADGLTYAQYRERLGRRLMARKVIEFEVRPKVKQVDEKDAKAYFEKVVAFINSGSSETPKGMLDEDGVALRQVAQQIRAMSSERVRVSRILIRLAPLASENEKKRALKTAQDVRKRLLEGTSTFAEVARAESEDPEGASRGGELGVILRGMAPPDFEKAAFSLPVGEFSEPILTDTGYNIIRVGEKWAAEKPEFERFKDQLAKFMMDVSFQKEMDAYVKSLKSKAVIERNPPQTL